MWGFGKENPPMPDSDELKKLAGKHSYRNIEFDDENTSVRFTDGGFSLDLGAAAKGYAMDMLDSYLRKSGVTSAVVDFGGSILNFSVFVPLKLFIPVMRTDAMPGVTAS